MELIAKYVLTFGAADSAAVLGWLQGKLRVMLNHFSTYEADRWPMFELQSVRIVPAADLRPFPMVQVRGRDPHMPYGPYLAEPSNPFPWYEPAEPLGVIRTALWAELRPLGNGQMDLLVGGDDEIDGVPWLLGKLAAAVKERFEGYSVIAKDGAAMPKYQDDKPINWDNGSKPIVAGMSGSLRDFDGQKLLVSKPTPEQLSTMVDDLTARVAQPQQAENRIIARGERVTPKHLKIELEDMEIERLMDDYAPELIESKTGIAVATVKDRIKKIKRRNSS